MSRVGLVQWPIIVGRDDLLELADRRIGEAAEGRGHLLLLSGEAGIGKTRLLDAIARNPRNVAVSRGRGAPEQLPAPPAPARAPCRR